MRATNDIKKDAQFNVYNFQKMLALPPQKFEWLRLDSNNDCNVHCVYCHNGRSKALISPEVLEEFLTRKVESVENFQVGCIMEPTLDARLADIFKLVAASKAKPSGIFMLQTNGTLLHRHDLSRLRESGLTHISVSIDSADPEIHKALRGGTRMDRVHSNLMAARKELPQVTIQFITTVNKLNVRVMKELVTFGLDLGVRRFAFREMFYFPNSKIVDHSRLSALVLEAGEYRSMKQELTAAFRGKADMVFADAETLERSHKRIDSDSLKVPDPMKGAPPRKKGAVPVMTAENVRFHSRWGGFWTDLNNAEEVLDGRKQMGLLPSEEIGRLRSWIQQGYVVLPGAVPSRDCDAALEDVDRVYSGALKTAYVEKWEKDKVEIVPARQEYRRMKYKLLDVYSISEAMRRVVFNDAVTRFLALVFERPVMAFQGLYFEIGSEQAIHQDTAYVRVQSPMLFAGVWVALEDIAQGSGELEYFPGSHRFPDYPFIGGSKSMVDRQVENAAYLKWLRNTADAHGIQRERFRPKKGDALVWAADFAHGGGKILEPQSTRRSHVAHYCPVSVKPHYFFRARERYAGPIEWAPNLSYAHPFY